MIATRRDLITGVTAIVTAPLLPVPAVASAPGQDDPVLALYTRWKAVHEDHLALLKRQDASDKALFAARDAGLPIEHLDAESDAAWDAVSEVCGRECDIEYEIALTRATSWRGIAAKISLAARTTRSTSGKEPADVADHLVESADDDITRLALAGWAT